MATDIGPKISVQGEAQFRKQLRDINTGLKTLGTEMQAVTSAFVGQEQSEESLSAQNNVLARTVDKLREKLEAQKQMLAEYAQAYGEADEKTQRMQQAVNLTTAELNKAEAQIKRNTEAMDKLGDEEADASGKSVGLKDALGSLGISMQDLTMAGVAGMVVAALKAIVDWMVDATKSAAEYGDSILTLSTNYSIATDKLQEYQYMAELTDTSVDTITGSITKLTKSMDAARSGTGDAAEAFALLGVNLYSANGVLRNSSDVFEEVIDKLGYIQSGTERDTITMALFGKSALELNSLIAVGAEGMRRYADEAYEMGYVLSTTDLQALGAMDDSFARLDKQMEAVKNRILVQMAPVLTELAEMLLEIAQKVNWEEFGRKAAQVIRTLAPVVILLAQSLAGLASAFASLLGIFNRQTPTDDAGRWKMLLTGINSVPRLAGGGVIQPNDPGLYVLGDNTTEREIVAPRSEMVDATMEALRMSGGGAQVINIQFSGDLAQLGRVLQPIVTADSARIGLVL